MHATLLKRLRATIEEAQGTTEGSPAAMLGLRRILALLWSAYDETETLLLAEAQGAPTAAEQAPAQAALTRISRDWQVSLAESWKADGIRDAASPGAVAAIEDLQAHT